VEESGFDSGADCGWVDYVQWSGPSPEQDPSNWQEINYKHDLYGRRGEKKPVVSLSNPTARTLSPNTMAITTCCANTSTARESTSRSA